MVQAEFVCTKYVFWLGSFFACISLFMFIFFFANLSVWDMHAS